MYNYQDYGYTYPRTNGEANITLHHNRAKAYDDGKVYLQNKQEFEIELFNPSTVTKLAKISINGKPISTAGIVVKPGQRVYLERFLDTSKKFLFETYSVDGSSAEVLAAIANNGLVEVQFYDEDLPTAIQATYTLSTTSSNLRTLYNVSGCTTDNCFNSSTPTGTFASQSKLASDNGRKTLKTVSRNGGQSASAEKQTGRVEQGGNSDQRFKQYNGDFRRYVNNTVTINILPYGERPLEANDLALYCTNCGTKNKKNNYKYCPQCGKSYEA